LSRLACYARSLYSKQNHIPVTLNHLFYFFHTRFDGAIKRVIRLSYMTTLSREILLSMLFMIIAARACKHTG
jgi:hypothetical protein